MAISFFLRSRKSETATIFARIRSRAKNIDIKASTLIEVNVSTWDKAHETAMKWKNYRNDKNNKAFFGKLDEIENTLNSILESDIEITNESVNRRIYEIIYAEQIAEEKKRIEDEQIAKEESERKAQARTFNEFIAQYIEECESGKRKKKGKTLNIAPGTIKSYKGFFSQLKAYQDARLRVVDFSDITINFYDDFRDYLVEKEYSPNTISRMIKVCKTICYAAEQLKLFDATNVRAAFEISYEKVDNIYLNDERIQELYDCDLSFKPAWEKVKDVFVVGCLTGQRVSDYKRINSKMIVTLTDGRKYIKLTQVKTGNLVYIPLDYRVESILEKYNGTLPKVFDQKINDHIKEIGEYLKWTESVELSVQKGNMKYTTNKRFCDLLKTHTCRRSLATNMYKAGAALSSIMAITGHSSEQQLKTYLKLDESEKSMLASKEGYFSNLRIAK